MKLSRLHCFHPKIVLNHSNITRRERVKDFLIDEHHYYIRNNVDFEKAFDTVWRDALWSKLLINNINGKMYNVIYNMYQNIKSRIVRMQNKNIVYRGISFSETTLTFV
jgi:hypothetical protein